MARILLISPYHALSHSLWAQGLMDNLRGYEWIFVSLPPRSFSWRVRGNALSLARHPALVDGKPEFDLLIATSMLDLSSVRSFIPALRSVPAVVYFHENQFSYPTRTKDLADVQLLSIKTALSADAIAFNSNWNRESFHAGAEQLLGRMPDDSIAWVGPALTAKSTVLPVPLPNDCYPVSNHRAGSSSQPLRLLWNHRWEHDKGAEQFECFLQELERRAIAFELSLCGQRFRQRPPALERIGTNFASQIKHNGFVESRSDYLSLLEYSDCVVSCSAHEFQGLAVLEAMAHGCLPLVPDRLSYREFVPSTHRYASTPEDPTAEVDAMVAMLGEMLPRQDGTKNRFSDLLAKLSWQALKPSYERLIERWLV